MFRILLRPICWIKGHANPVVKKWELMPIGLMVCSRCRKLAPDKEQYIGIVTQIEEIPDGLLARITLRDEYKDSI